MVYCEMKIVNSKFIQCGYIRKGAALVRVIIIKILKAIKGARQKTKLNE